MNFNVYVDDATGRKLARLARQRATTRNALIRQAVQDLVQRAEQPTGWPAEVLQWQGDPAFEAFESHRRELAPAAEDPLA
jgi:predicted transcriptional regulator